MLVKATTLVVFGCCKSEHVQNQKGGFENEAKRKGWEHQVGKYVTWKKGKKYKKTEQEEILEQGNRWRGMVSK
jgi:hypothetical protein